MIICRQCLVSGKVQGVFYRAKTRDKSYKLKFTWCGRKLVDGNVKVIICGEKKQVDLLIAWLYEGPPEAIVADIIVTELENITKKYHKFTIKG